ncbi:hypothetical protein PHYPSEUDO_012330 [Phytophthora pseudosyringae]|uniref:Uncharacterized protein n=1 Tax=Phytophthora pseudosyringae TaxID=221518 RepID=A0A8T1V7K7_9STRA|nr:hypothetical protein PHYPSEUDO_012330 [Phytophthora pseudosyringae]
MRRSEAGIEAGLSADSLWGRESASMRQDTHSRRESGGRMRIGCDLSGLLIGRVITTLFGMWDGAIEVELSLQAVNMCAEHFPTLRESMQAMRFIFAASQLPQHRIVPVDALLPIRAVPGSVTIKTICDRPGVGRMNAALLAKPDALLMLRCGEAINKCVEHCLSIQELTVHARCTVNVYLAHFTETRRATAWDITSLARQGPP